MDPGTPSDVRGRRPGTIVGRIRRRLLVNAWVDPAEVESCLPDPLRPHIGSTGGVVVGCCMIELDEVRPWLTPKSVGMELRAAAHRISCDMGPVDRPTRAVFVPVRLTDSRISVLAGGRVFPGVHRAASIDVAARSDLRWRVAERGSAQGFGITAVAGLTGKQAPESEVAEIVVGTVLGLSPGHRAGALEAVVMEPENASVATVDLVDLDSEFISGFRTAELADTLLMTEVEVAWTRSQPLFG